MNWDKFWGWLLMTSVGGVLLGFVAIIVMMIIASGRVEYCYVTHTTNTTAFTVEQIYTLYGWRDWREDQAIGRFSKLEDATAAAASMKCPMTMERR